jgi:hypothetical protein
MKTHSSARALPLLTLVLVACGADPVPPPAAPAATETAAAEPAPPSPPPEPPPTATASASAAAAAAPPKRESSGRPSVVKQDAQEIHDTFGVSPGAKLELVGDKERAVLKLPEFSLPQATNILFKLDNRGKSGGFQIGKIYRIQCVIPPGSTPIVVESGGPPFELALPAGNKKNANLAIGVEDDKGKVTWTVRAPSRIDDAQNLAYFELTALPAAWVHVTSKPAPDKK